MSSLIMRRTEIADRASRQQRDSTAKSEGMPFAWPRLEAGAWRDLLTMALEALDESGWRGYAGQLLIGLMNAIVLGGVFVVPVAALVALCCMWMPANHPLHHTAPTFFGFASLWFMLALALAHFQRDAQDAEREAA